MIQPTDDYEFIKSVCLHPKVWPYISDDYCNFATFEPDLSHLYLEVIEDERMGFFAIKPLNSITFEIHTTMLPKAWGRTLQYTKEVLEWIWSNTECMNVITFIPENNMKALKLAEKSGLTQKGFIENSWLKDGRLFGQYIFGIARGNICQSQPQ